MSERDDYVLVTFKNAAAPEVAEPSIAEVAATFNINAADIHEDLGVCSVAAADGGIEFVVKVDPETADAMKEADQDNLITGVYTSDGRTINPPM